MVVVPSSPAANSLVDSVAALCPSAVCVTHARDVDDARLVMNVLAGFLASPNVSKAYLCGVGHEDDPVERIADAAARLGAPVEVVTLLGEGGYERTVNRVATLTDASLRAAGAEIRTPADPSELVLGTACGGSDALSGLTANPVVGECVDKLIALGGSAILAELTELIGAEDQLAARAVSLAVGRALTEAIRSWETFALEFGDDLSQENITPGNIRGGITTIEEKSLGCVRKAGTTPVCDFVGCGGISTKRGLIVMDTDGDDVSELIALTAGGANVIAFTTGRGTPAGSPLVPTIKIASNSQTARRMPGITDMDAGAVMSGNETIASMADRLLDLVFDVANGRMTAAERNGQRDFALPVVRASA